MTVAYLKAMLGHPVAFHAILGRICNRATAGLMLSQALYWSRITEDEDGWFYKSQRQWEEETCLSRREQETARKRLHNLGFWDEKLRGVPATLYFKVDLEKLAQAIEQYVNCDKPRFAESAKPDWRKTPSKNGGKCRTSEAESAELYKEERLPKTTKKNRQVVDFNLKEFVRQIQQAHPRFERGRANEAGIIDAISVIAREDGIPARAAAEYLLARTKLYGECTSTWPDKTKITSSTRWFSSGHYRQDDAVWKQAVGAGQVGKLTRVDYTDPALEKKNELIARAQQQAGGVQ
jgi:hypothetical protein